MIRDELKKFFTIAPDSQRAVVGLWLADSASIAQSIEKDFLTRYKAEPDEKQAEEIRERLKSTSVYFRCDDTGGFQMLTIAGDSMGVSAGALKFEKSSGKIENFTAVLKGKNQEKNVHIRIDKAKNIFEYFEGHTIIIAHRETMQGDALTEKYFKQINQSTGLIQY